jgi:hypothetical protein
MDVRYRQTGRTTLTTLAIQLNPMVTGIAIVMAALIIILYWISD